MIFFKQLVIREYMAFSNPLENIGKMGRHARFFTSPPLRRMIAFAVCLFFANLPVQGTWVIMYVKMGASKPMTNSIN